MLGTQRLLWRDDVSYTLVTHKGLETKDVMVINYTVLGQYDCDMTATSV